MATPVKTRDTATRESVRSAQSIFQRPLPPQKASLHLINTRGMQSSKRLSLLGRLRRFSTPMTIALVGAVLPVYGWTVYTQRSWGQTYDRLEQLRRTERQLVALTEAQKYQVTHEIAQNPSGFVPQGPQNTLFLKQEPPRSLKKPAEKTSPLHSTPGTPIGY